MAEWTRQKSTKVWHTTVFTSLRFSSVITMLTLPLIFTYLTLSKQLWSLIFMRMYQISLKRNFSGNFSGNSPVVEIFRNWTVSADPREMHQNICGNCPATENLHTTKSEEISALYGVEATFTIIYLCLLFSSGLSFSIKYVSYDSLNILLYSELQRTP